MRKINCIVGLLLILSGLLLSVMIPGGPIETRDFSQINPGVLGLFNIFLTALGLVSFGAAVFAFRREPISYYFALVIAICYFGVYVLDLLQIFPRSPVAMPMILRFLEVTGTVVSVPLAIGSVLLISQRRNEKAVRKSTGFFLPVWLWILVVIIGISIVIFATISAMGLR